MGNSTDEEIEIIVKRNGVGVANLVKKFSENQRALGHDNISTLFFYLGENRVDIENASLNYLKNQIKNSNEYFTAKSSSRIIYGLKDTPTTAIKKIKEIEGILSAVNTKIEIADDRQFNAENISLSLYGLQNINFDKCNNPRIVDSLLQTLCNKIEESNANLDSNEITKSIYGLQCLGNSKNITGILKALKIKLEHSTVVDIDSSIIVIRLHNLLTIL